MDQSEFQKSQAPNTSLDDSPFLNVKNSRQRRKKTQSKLTYLKQVSAKRKKNDAPKTNENENNSQREIQSKERSLRTLSGEPCSSVAMIYEKAIGNKEENAIQACPVCWKKFENVGDQMQHMKACASKHNLTLQQLLDAVDLQTKQIEERKTLGLPCVPATSIAKKSTSKKSSPVCDKNDPDLQMGLALSVSMKESEEENHLMKQEILLEAGLGDEVASNQASLLERYGFTNTRPVLPSIYPRSRPGKTKLKSTPLLLIRTQDERERLITEKVAIVLTNEENKLSPPSAGEHESSVKSYCLQSKTLTQLQNNRCCLWQKASASPSPKDCDTYYVQPLSSIISPSTIKAGSKLKHLSQVPCRLKTPEKCLPTTFEDASLNLMGNHCEMFSVVSQDSLSQQMNEEKSSFSDSQKIADSTNTNIQEKSRLFVSRFIGDWNNMLNNSHLSDIKIRVQDCEEIYVHGLVLSVRCPKILLDVKQVNDSMKYIIWDKISFKCALAFLEFIYCGSTCKIDELMHCAEEIIFLSTKYCVKDLCSYLECIAREGKDYGIRKCLELNGISNVNSVVGKPYHCDVNDALIDNFHLVFSSCKSETERSSPIPPENNVSETEDKRIESNCKNEDIVECDDSLQKNDSLHDSCLSPDPFVDSCDHEINSSPPNTQQNIDIMLEALNVDEGEKFHQIKSKCSVKIDFDQLGSCGFDKESPELEIIDKERDDIFISSTIKKRKLPNYCDSLDVKQICMNDRNSVRKSLLPCFFDEGDKFPNEKDEVKINSPNVCKSNSLNSVESVGNVSVKSSKRADEINLTSTKILKEADNTNSPSLISDVFTIESNSRTSSETVNVCVVPDKVQDISTDLLGDFCADYEYQNFCANYSPCSEKILSYPQFDAEKSAKNSFSQKQSFLETNEKEDLGKSPFSSPLSVKSLSRGDSPLIFHKNRSSRKNLAFLRTRSSSDIRVDNYASLLTPISVKCLSQSSIHFKPSHDTNTVEIQSVNDVESDVLKIDTTSKINMQSPVTPCTHVQITPNRSLNSIKQLLEDSFTAELGSNLLERKLDCESWPCSTPNSTLSTKFVFSKHLQSIKDGENCVTPMADYSDMDTPMLKRELQKYGLKPLKRKRAKQILKHIYNELHPLVPVQSNDDKSDLVNSAQDGVLPLSCTTKQSDKTSTPKKFKKKTKIQRDCTAIDSIEKAEFFSENEVSFPSMQESSSSSQCQFEVPEDPTEDSALTQLDVTELSGVVHNYIRTNPAIHQQVLLYEPISLEQLQDSLRAQNYKFKLSQIMEYLDEQCITFRSIQGNKTKGKKKKNKK